MWSGDMQLFQQAMEYENSLPEIVVNNDETEKYLTEVEDILQRILNFTNQQDTCFIPSLHESLVFHTQAIITKLKHEINDWHKEKDRCCGEKRLLKDTTDSLQTKSRRIFSLLNQGLTAMIKFSSELCNTTTVSEYVNNIKELVQSCLIVENQPHELLKKDTNHNCVVQHLLADDLNIKENVVADVKLFGENTENQMHCRKESGKFEPSQCVSHCSVTGNPLKFEWKKMKLKEIERSRNSFVTEEKHFLLFSTSIPVLLPYGEKLLVHCEVLSSPFVVIAAAKQICPALGSLFWDRDILSKYTRSNINPVGVVTWQYLWKCLDARWRNVCASNEQLGQGLDHNASMFLEEKLFERRYVHPDTPVTWEMFQRNKISEKEFSFWEYFYRILDLTTCDAIKPYWNKGLIHGFLTRSAAKQLLLEQKPGTFLFRFSQHLVGKNKDYLKAGITLSFNHLNENNRLAVDHLEPYTDVDLKKKSLSDLIDYVNKRCDHQLQFLHPNKPASLFYEFKSETPKPSTLKGYIPKSA